MYVTSTARAGKIFANPGDTITVENRNSIEYNVLKINDWYIYSTWKSKAWIEAHCEEIK